MPFTRALQESGLGALIYYDAWKSMKDPMEHDMHVITAVSSFQLTKLIKLSNKYI